MDRPRARRKEICPGSSRIGRARRWVFLSINHYISIERLRTACLDGMRAHSYPYNQDGQSEIVAVVRSRRWPGARE